MARSLAFPLQLMPGGALLTNEQGTEADVANGIEFALSWPQGTRTLDPSFGRPVDTDGGIPDADAMAAAAERSEPRCRARGDLVSQTIASAVERIGFDFV